MSPRSRLLSLSLLCALSVGIGAGLAPAAEACGGLFCAQVPVDQAGERILFAGDGENVVAHVQIQYQGDANKFSWVVPTPSQPTLGVGSDSLFQLLRQATRPVFQLNRRQEGTCGEFSPATPVGSVFPSTGASASPGVAVVSEGQVGPYDSVVLQANDPGALKTWLRENEYDIPQTLDPLLDPYVAGKYYFVALKLQKNRSTGDLQPIVLKYKATKPGIPIRLTGIAATPDMDVYVWVLGKNRAIPENYRHAQINEARIDWVNSGTNYRQVVTEAMNEAGGQAFVTDYAGPSNRVALTPLPVNGLDLETLRQLKDPIGFTRVVMRDGMFLLGARLYPFLNRYVPKPEAFKNVADDRFYNALSYLGDENFAEPEVALYRQAMRDAQIQADGEGAAKELEETIYGPNREVSELFQKHPYLTQLYTTLSPDEMTQDPTFLFNAELPPVDNMHQAEGVVECSPAYSWFNAPMRIKLSNGVSFQVTQQGTAAGQPIAMPAALRIEQLKTTGPAAVIQDNQGAIAQAIASAGAYGFGANGAPVTVTPSQPVNGSFGCTGCAQTNAPPPPVTQGVGEGVAYGFVLLGWLGYRRWLDRK